MNSLTKASALTRSSIQLPPSLFHAFFFLAAHADDKCINAGTDLRFFHSWLAAVTNTHLLQTHPPSLPRFSFRV